MYAFVTKGDHPVAALQSVARESSVASTEASEAVGLSENERIEAALKEYAKRSRMEQVFCALRAIAKIDRQRRAVVNDPVDALSAHLRKPSILRYLRELEDSSVRAIQTVRDGGRGGGGGAITKVILLTNGVPKKPKKDAVKLEISESKKLSTDGGGRFRISGVIPKTQGAREKEILHSYPRVAVFLDADNLLIAAQRIGVTFDVQYMMDELARRVRGSIVSVFVCMAALTERRKSAEAQQLRALRVPGFAYRVTGNTPDAADYLLCDAIRESLAHTDADIYVIGTCDGGAHFINAIRLIRYHRRRIIVVKYGGKYTEALKRLADACFDVSPVPALIEKLRRVVQDVSLGRPVPVSPEATFLRSVASAVWRAYMSIGESTFVSIAERTWQILYS